MKKALKTLVVVVALVLTLALTGCQDINSLTGNWYYYDGSSLRDNIYYTFNADGTGGYTYSGSTNKFTYEDDGTKVSLKYENATIANEYEYKIEDGTLTIKDSFGSDVIYKKK